MDLRTLITSTAVQYLGKKETPGNSGFEDKRFEQMMKEVGWSKGLAWCSFLGELIWKQAYRDSLTILMDLEKKFSGSATTTWKNFSLDKSWECNKTPAPGCLVIWRYGNGWQGHLGVVIKVNPDGSWISLEGNSNNDGSREGYEAVMKNRKPNKTLSPKGLNLLGFVHPKVSAS